LAYNIADYLPQTLLWKEPSNLLPSPLPDPIEAILYYMEIRGLTRRDLEQYIGSRARVSEILNRKRPLTMEMIRSLHEGLGIPAEVLIQPYRTFKNAA
jgi:HTH-type transcriptional regulator / antitoxin HigA